MSRRRPRPEIDWSAQFPLVRTRKGDDPAAVKMLEALTAGLVDAHRPDEVFVTRIDGWFSRKWLGFAGKFLGELGCGSAEKDVCIPPFIPSRVVRRRHLDFDQESRSYVATKSRVALHPWQHSGTNLNRKVDRIIPNAVLVWIGSGGDPGKISVMAYATPMATGTCGHATLLRSDGWKFVEPVGFHPPVLRGLVERGRELRLRPSAPTE